MNKKYYQFLISIIYPNNQPEIEQIIKKLNGQYLLVNDF